MTRDKPNVFAHVPAGHCICNLCRPPTPVPIADILVHIRVDHGVQVEPMRWPDGQLVIVDTTLEPADFEADK